MRRLVEIPCAGDTLAGTLDQGSGKTGLLIVSGGNELRIGAHRGMATLAQRLAESGVSVLRFDRRGIGDSTGTNRSFRGAATDIAAATAYFTAETGIKRLVAFGNCDAATALALFHQAAGIDALVLANPWVIESQDDLPPASAIRRRYVERFFDPASWVRLARGEISFRKLAKGLRKISDPSAKDDGTLATEMRSALLASRTPATIILAERDVTAIAFAAAWPHTDMPIRRLATASHSFAHPGDMDQVEAILREIVSG